MKYEILRDDKIEVAGHTLYRIRALRDFNDVKAGDLGGYIEGKENLSQEGNCWVYGNACVCGNAQINKSSDVLCISPIGSRNDITTFFKTKDGNICVKCGCFRGTIDEFLEAVSKKHDENKHAKAYRLACELARVQIELEE